MKLCKGPSWKSLAMRTRSSSQAVAAAFSASFSFSVKRPISPVKRRLLTANRQASGPATITVRSSARMEG